MFKSEAQGGEGAESLRERKAGQRQLGIKVREEGWEPPKGGFAAFPGKESPPPTNPTPTSSSLPAAVVNGRTLRNAREVIRGSSGHLKNLIQPGFGRTGTPVTDGDAPTKRGHDLLYRCSCSTTAQKGMEGPPPNLAKRKTGNRKHHGGQKREGGWCGRRCVGAGRGGRGEGRGGEGRGVRERS